METEIMNKAESFVKNAKIKQKTIKSACLDVTEELEYSHSLESKLREDAKHNKLFIAMKNVAKRLPLLEDKEKQVLDENTIDDCIKLTRNTYLINQFESENVYGILFTGVQPTPDRTINIQYTDTINMKTKSEEKQCIIMGMVMIAPTRMIVADNTNFKIKLIDSERRVVVTEIKMSSQPVDVIILPENKLAVTLESEKCIQILSYTDVELSSDRRIDVKELCNGIAYCQYKFVVTCWSSKKIININLEGCILKVLRSPAMFNGPSRVLISKDEKFLYVTDRDLRSNSSVMKIDLEGNLISAFKESGYAVPYGLQQLEDETILVCFQDRGTVLRLTSSLKRCDIIGPEKENIYRPKAITYCNIYHKLYVSCSSEKGKQNADIVKVFNVKWI